MNIMFKNVIEQRSFWMVEYNFFVTLMVGISSIVIFVMLMKDSNLIKEILDNIENKGMKFKCLVILQFSFLGIVWVGDYYITNHIYYSILPLLCILIVTIICKVAIHKH